MMPWFFVQEKLSDYKDQTVSGTYELNTAMSIEDMLAVLYDNGEMTEAVE